MAKNVKAVLSLETRRVRDLVEEKAVVDCSRMDFCDEFLQAVEEVLEGRTGYVGVPSALLTRYCGELADVEKLGGDIGVLFPTASVNFVFDLRVPSDAILELPYARVMELNSAAESGCEKEVLCEDILAAAKEMDEDMVGFVSKVPLEWVTRFAVLNSEWEIETRRLSEEDERLKEMLPMHCMRDAIEYRRNKDVQ